MDTSECDKLAAAAGERRALCDFLEWAGSQGIFLAHYQHIAEYRNPQLAVVPEQADQIVLRYLNIDPVALERERRALLAQASNRPVSEDRP